MKPLVCEECGCQFEGEDELICEDCKEDRNWEQSIDEDEDEFNIT